MRDSSLSLDKENSENSQGSEKWQSQKIEDDYRFWELFGIHIINFIFTILTLGVYSFWGKVRIRQYLWKHTLFAGDRFEYTGTGWELFKSFLIVMLIMAPIGLLISFAANYFMQNQMIVPLVGLYIVIIPTMIFLLGYVEHSLIRYQLSRTQWRGIRGGLTGRPLEHGKKILLYTFLSSISSGLLLPWLDCARWNHLINNTYIGNRKLSLDAKPGFLFGKWVGCWLLLLPTLGLSMLWYQMIKWRYLAGQIQGDGLRAKFKAKGSDFFWFQVINMLLLVLTAGLAYPYIQIRTLRFVSRHLTIGTQGSIDTLAQSTLARPGSGEGLAEAIDFGGAF